MFFSHRCGNRPTRLAVVLGVATALSMAGCERNNSPTSTPAKTSGMDATPNIAPGGSSSEPIAANPAIEIASAGSGMASAPAATASAP